MVVFVVLLVSLAVFRLAGFLGLPALDNWDLPLRLALLRDVSAHGFGALGARAGGPDPHGAGRVSCSRACS
jgi:hypothetical protein